MRLRHTALLLALTMTAASVLAYEANWKRGRIYYRSVCTTCHESNAIGAINPSSKLQLEWKSYFEADKHAGGKDTLSHYTSRAYRASIANSSRAAKKFADVPDAEMLEDVRTFLIRGAKDGVAPASCS